MLALQVRTGVQQDKEIRDRVMLGLQHLMVIGCMLVLAMQHQAVRFN